VETIKSGKVKKY
jgi:hypothetical protein